jgi:DHA2 family multidrug resistance protein
MTEAVRHRGAIAACIMMATLMQALDTTIANIALPHMQGTFSASQDQINWVLTSYIVAAAIATPPTGWLSRRFGRSRLYLVSVAGFTAASVLCGLAQNLEEMVLFRLLQGICGAFFSPLGQATILDIFPKERQPSAMALWGFGSMIGPVLGPSLGGWLTENLDWRWVFFINLPIGALTWLGLLTFLRDTEPTKKPSFDWFGFSTLSIAIAALQLMCDRGVQLDWFDSTEIIVECAIGGVTFYMFLVHMWTADQPFIPPALFRDRNFTIACLFIFVLCVLLFGSIALTTPFIQSLLGYPVVTAGLIMAPRGIGTMIMMSLVGRFSNRIDIRVILLAGLALMIHALWDMSRFTADVDEWTIVTNGFEQGMAVGMLFLPMTTAGFTTLPPELRAEGASMFGLARNVGGAIGISIFITLLDRSIRLNHAEIAGYLTPFNRALDLRALSGPHAGTAAAMLDGQVSHEAVTIAYLNDFRAMMYLGVVMLPMALILRIRHTPTGQPAEALAID